MTVSGLEKKCLQRAEQIVQGRDLPWLLAQWCERCPDKVFLIWSSADTEDQQWTYAQFSDSVRRVAAGLTELGVQPGQRLLLHMENCPEFLFTYFACAHLGIIAVITNTRSVARELAQSIQLTEVAGVLTQAHFLPLLREAGSSLPLVIVSDAPAGEVCEPSAGEAIESSADNAALNTSTHPPAQERATQKIVSFDALLDYPPIEGHRPRDPSCDLRVQFTSGTTSQPKAVLSTHANAVFAAQQTALGYGLRHEDICQVFVPLFHTNGLSTLVTSTLWVGGTILLQRKFSASNFWEPALKYKATWSCLPGAFFTQALKPRPVPKHDFRFWITGCSPALAKQFAIETRGHWGMTEMITLPILDDPHHPSPAGSIGRPAPGIDVAIRRDDGSDCHPGETGSVYVRGTRGITLFKEYLNNPDATANSFDANGWFITGDKVRIDTEGYLYFEDRQKDLLRVGGENVAASEIEAVIQKTGWVQECAVVGQKHAMLDEVPVAFVKPDENAPTDLKQQLIKHCQQHLADFKVIRDVHIVDDFPRAALQKIAKYKLREQLPVME